MSRRYRTWAGTPGAALVAILSFVTAAHAQEAAERFRTPSPEAAPSGDPSEQRDEAAPEADSSETADDDLPGIQFGQFDKLGDGACRGQKTLNTLLRERGALRGCIASRLDPKVDADLEGRVDLQWSVAPDDEVTWASIERSTLERPQIEKCLVETIEVTAFDGPNGGNCRFQYTVEVGDPGMPGVASDPSNNLEVAGSGGMGERTTSEDDVGFGHVSGLGGVETGDLSEDEDANEAEPESTSDGEEATLARRLLSAEGCQDDSIEDSVRGKQNALQYCYERELGDTPELAGRVVLHWTIGADGSVQSVEISESTLDDSSVAECANRVVRRIRHEAPDGGSCHVEYRLEFAPQGPDE